jgi:predicted metal-dependent hydrolase
MAQQRQGRCGEVQAAPTAATGLATTAALLLDRWAWHRAERTEHAAIAWIWAQQRPTFGAFVVELAGVCGHGFLLCMVAVWASQHGFENDGGAHRGLTPSPWTDSPRWSWPWSMPPAGPCQRHR